ncbi:MAG: dihydroorotase [Xanthomonadaceae bacterium]|nr:dihydroorotase [Xanthomonadaceae bacterium]
MDRLTITRPDDWHLHLRDGAALASVLPHTAAQFARAIVMPNLRPPVTTVELARKYRDRILRALPLGAEFEPLMTLYLTDNTKPDEITAAKASGFVHGVKLYPAGATTNSDAGVTSVDRAMPALEAMATAGVPLLVHGEVTDPKVDPFDREARFIERVLSPLMTRLPHLKLVLEHVTTLEGIEFVRHSGPNVAATITAHHLLYDRRAMFQGGLRPHYFCLPVLKRAMHRDALLDAATSGNTKYFLGTDSAPHERGLKESDCGCAGIYTAHAALELYAEAFDAAGRLDRLEGFASHHGADFYGLPRNTDTVTLTRNSWRVPDAYPFADSEVVPLKAGEEIGWRVA